MTRLLKPIEISYVPGRAGQAGFPGVIGYPPRQVTRTREVCTYSATLPPNFPPNSGISKGGGRRCRMVTTIETVPGTPSSSPIPPVAAEPATIIYDYKRGWTGRARSISVIPAAGTFTFTVPASTVGAMVGMTAEPRSEGFADILFGFYVNRGAVRIYESGVDVLSVGAFPNAELAITREGGFIRYFVNGTMVRERPNESAPLYLGASLYMAGDAVDDAEIETFASGGGSATFLPMQAIGGSVAYAFGSASFLPMTAEGSQDRTGSGAATFPVMQAFGNGPGSYYATGGASFLPMTSAGDAYGLEPTYGVGLAQSQPMVAGGFGYTGTVGSGAATFEPLFAVGADRPYAYGASRFEPMLSYGDHEFGDGVCWAVDRAGRGNR